MDAFVTMPRVLHDVFAMIRRDTSKTQEVHLYHPVDVCGELHATFNLIDLAYNLLDSTAQSQLWNYSD